MFILSGEIMTNGAKQIRFFQYKNSDTLFVSVASDVGNCAVFSRTFGGSGQFKKLQEFDGTCRAIEMFKQEENG